MKKLLSYLLTFVMLITIIIPAARPASAVVLQDTTAQSKDVLADVTAPVVEDVFYVELEWGSMEFNIADTGTRVYNPGTQQIEYSPSVTVAPAEEGANVFSLTNKSNHMVRAELYITDKTKGALSGTIYNSSGENLGNREVGLTMQESDTTAHTYTLAFEATDEFKMETAENVKIATIDIRFL